VLLPQTLITRSDSRPGLGSIDWPALVVVGGDDRITPLELSEEIAANIPGARLELVADCGRLSTLEQPEALTKVLVDWRSQ
jgi:pimeloyl-ACP methyl ester carboxylesterase